MRRLHGIGVDLLSRARVVRLIGRSPTKISNRLLSQAEQKVWRKRRFTPVLLARYLTAKEAFFKAIGGPWLGPDGFRNFEVHYLARGKFFVKSLLGNSYDICAMDGCFFQNDQWVGAQVILWDKG